MYMYFHTYRDIWDIFRITQYPDADKDFPGRRPISGQLTLLAVAALHREEEEEPREADGVAHEAVERLLHPRHETWVYLKNKP